jgi:UDP-2,4-diacetamido-2,4,6-trideoxy-beta-L-altropyranose hydrolase
VRINIVTEARVRVGSGHFRESLVLAEALRSRGATIEVFVPDDVPAKLLSLATVPVRRIPDCEPSTLGEVATAADSDGTVVNLRAVAPEQLEALSNSRGRVLCIDETGRDLPCDVLVNPTWSAPRSSGQAKVIRHGPAFLPMDPVYVTLNGTARRHREPIRTMVATFGGSDGSHISLAVIRSLKSWRQDVTKTLIVGAMAENRPQIEEELRSLADSSWELLFAPPSLARILQQADVGLTAGGNTLFELACVGTPAIVIHEDPHEGVAGREFAARGFGRALCQAADLREDDLITALNAFDDPELRQRHSDSGRQLVDGRGVGRIADLIEEMIR